MKKLNLLLPDERRGYLMKGKGQKIRYLKLSEEMNTEALKQDIANGAVQFKEIEKLTEKKKIPRFVIINTSSEEEGLMAASYLASAYNYRDKVYDEFSDFDEAMEDEYGFTQIKPENMVSVLEEAELEKMKDEEGEDIEENTTWTESPVTIPIINIEELHEYDYGFDSLRLLDYNCESQTKKTNNQPYWVTCMKEPVIIIQNETGPEFGSTYSLLGIGLERFSTNRHVYLIVVHNEENEDISRVDDIKQRMLCEITLDYTADIANVYALEEEKRQYYSTIFENLIENQGATLKKGFNTASIVNSILDIKRQDRLKLINNVIRYVIMDVINEGKSMTLTEEAFSIMKRFNSLGISSGIDKKERAEDKLALQISGMNEIKERVRAAVQVLRFNKIREREGFKGNDFHNVYVFAGAPGTAKTTIARLMGDMMVEEKLLRNNRFKSLNGAELKGMFVGQTAPKVAEIFKNNDIIFIDEAYSLTAASMYGEIDQYSHEALAQLAIELENHGRDRLVIFAGYGGSDVDYADNKMKQFIEANPGIRSRINEVLYFPSYTVKEMIDITLRIAENKQYKIDKKSVNLIHDYFQERIKDKSFGNGREARNLIENAVKQASVRLTSSGKELSKELLGKLTYDDIKSAIRNMLEGNRQIKGQRRKSCGFNIMNKNITGTEKARSVNNYEGI